LPIQVGFVQQSDELDESELNDVELDEDSLVDDDESRLEDELSL
jgi:hypothetical protein